jgi:hypothetical protein
MQRSRIGPGMAQFSADGLVSQKFARKKLCVDIMTENFLHRVAGN